MRKSTARRRLSSAKIARVARGLPSSTAVAALVVLSLSSCTTTSVDPTTLPSALTTQFDRCVPRDGTAELSFYHKGKLVAAELTLDFVAKAADTLAAELANPLGQTLFTLNLTPPSRKIKVRGARQLKQQIELDDEGFLRVDDTVMGLKLTELICGLSGVWPQSWLRSLSSVTYNSAKTLAKLSIEDERRKISLALPLTGKMPKRCAQISVSYFMGLHKEQLKLCLDPARSLGSLSRSAPDQTLRWSVVTD